MQSYQWNAKVGEEEFLSWTIYDNRHVGITFKSTPNLTQNQLIDIIIRLNDINRTMGEG